MHRPLVLTTRPCVGMTVNVRQHDVLDFTGLYLRHPVVIVLEVGEKQVRWQGGECLLHAGEAIALAGNQTIDISDRHSREGDYRAYWLIGDEGLVSDFAANCPPGMSPVQTAMPLGLLDVETRQACDRAKQAIEEEGLPLEIARHRFQEVLWWLRSKGAILQTVVDQSVTDRVRAMIANQPSLDWNGPSIAAALAMSEATLRRKLAAEDTSFSDVLLDVRMTCAAQLLQNTLLPITQIAHEVGYGSPSHFTQRFRQRFGFLPSAIREAASNAEV